MGLISKRNALFSVHQSKDIQKEFDMIYTLRIQT